MSSPSPHGPQLNEEEWVALQFDDKVFVVLRQTLADAGGDSGSLFAQVFAADAVSFASLARNPTHPLRPILFDRPAQYVAPLLHYLRQGELILPLMTPDGDAFDPAVARGVLIEARYFGLSKVVNMLEPTEERQQRSSPCPEPAAMDCAREEQGSGDRVALGTSTTLEGRAVDDQAQPDSGEVAAASVPLVELVARRAAEKRSKILPNTMDRLGIERLLMALPGGTLAARPRWCGMRFNSVDFSYLSLAGISFAGCELNQCSFAYSDLTGTTFDDAELVDANFSFSNFVNVKCRRSNLTKAQFRSTNCTGSDLTCSMLIEVDFSQANLHNCDMQASNMSCCVLMGANLSGAKLHKAVLSGVQRQGTSLTMGGVIA